MQAYLWTLIANIQLPCSTVLALLCLYRSYAQSEPTLDPEPGKVRLPAAEDSGGTDVELKA